MLSAKTYKTLKNMIYQGRLQPGQRLVERDLCDSLSISRIPLRESLIRLESEGLVRSVPNSATFVEDFSPKDVLEMYSMRLQLEPLATRLAALHSTEALVRRLNRLCEQMTRDSQSGNWANLDRTDYKFHHAIVAASKHQQLIRAYNHCHIQITGLRANFSHLKSSPPTATATEHQRIIDCLEQRDAAGAEQATHEHVARAMRNIETYLDTRLEELR